MALFDTCTHAANDSSSRGSATAYHKVVRVPYTPPKEHARVPPSYHASACVRCVEGGGSQWNLFDARDIGRFWAQDKYTCFQWRWPDGGDDEQILDESLRQLELRLQHFGFVRVHRRELVNLRFVRQVKLVSSADGARALIVLQDGTRVHASRRGTRLLKKHLLQMGHIKSAPRARHTAA